MDSLINQTTTRIALCYCWKQPHDIKNHPCRGSQRPECKTDSRCVAAACYRLGHRVRRWRGPLSGRVPYRRRLPHCDLAIIFNGAHPLYRPTIQRLNCRGVKKLFVELGWFPQSGSFQIDPRGINSAASWVGAPLSQTPEISLEMRPSGGLLVLLQDDADTQITLQSPWFDDMHGFLRHIVEYSTLPVRVRPHPRHRESIAVANLIANSGCQLDESSLLSTALQDCRAIACINSSSAVEALAHHLPVLCYGESIYRHAGVVHCLTNDGEKTRAITNQLLAGHCGLFANLIDEFLARVHRNQWRLADIPSRLPKLLGKVLNNDTRVGHWTPIYELGQAG